MEAFAAGEADVLVATSVIEVGIDVPNATVMLIEAAERYGLSQLHQLRGRIGRGEHESLCLLFGPKESARLRALAAHRDGFQLAEIDLRMRGEGELAGVRQAGRSDLRYASLSRQRDLVARARAATAEYERLRAGELKDFRVVLLHGQLKPREKAAAMAEFAAGGADVLVATTVIEVGIDVPNASVMLVENAERYGISQLHQLRGRIGRGPHDSLCLLFGPKDSRRLKALADHTDGFKLAEIDLELRGEGEMLGVRQSGLAQFRVARLPEDAELLDGARRIATALLEADPELAEPEHALLEWAVRAAYGADALDPIPA